MQSGQYTHTHQFQDNNNNNGSNNVNDSKYATHHHDENDDRRKVSTMNSTTEQPEDVDIQPPSASPVMYGTRPPHHQSLTAPQPYKTRNDSLTKKSSSMAQRKAASTNNPQDLIDEKETIKRPRTRNANSNNNNNNKNNDNDKNSMTSKKRNKSSSPTRQGRYNNTARDKKSSKQQSHHDNNDNDSKGTVSEAIVTPGAVEVISNRRRQKEISLEANKRKTNNNNNDDDMSTSGHDQHPQSRTQPANSHQKFVQRGVCNVVGPNTAYTIKDNDNIDYYQQQPHHIDNLDYDEGSDYIDNLSGVPGAHRMREDDVVVDEDDDDYNTHHDNQDSDNMIIPNRRVPSNNSGNLYATAVDDAVPIIEAGEIKRSEELKQEESKKQRSWIICFVCFMVVALAVGFTVGYLGRGNKNETISTFTGLSCNNRNTSSITDVWWHCECDGSISVNDLPLAVVDRYNANLASLQTLATNFDVVANDVIDNPGPEACTPGNIALWITSGLQIQSSLTNPPDRMFLMHFVLSVFYAGLRGPMWGIQTALQIERTNVILEAAPTASTNPKTGTPETSTSLSPAQDLFASTWFAGANWCQWEGVLCRPGSTEIAVLRFESANLNGTIPESIGVIQSLRSLEMGYNLLTGTIPTSIIHLPSLNIISLPYNKLTGELPLGQVSSSQFYWVELQGNQLRGMIPPGLESLPRLRYLDLSLNQFTGPFPVGLNTQDELEFLNLAGNQLTGTLPSIELGTFIDLEYFNISSNDFSGTIPNQVEFLTEVEYIDVSDNPKLSGTLPMGVQNMIDLLFVDISKTSINVTQIPVDFCHALFLLEGISVTCPASLLLVMDSTTTTTAINKNSGSSLVLCDCCQCV